MGEHPAGPLDGHRPARVAARPRGGRAGGTRRRLRGGLQPQRRGGQPGGAGDDPAARPPARGGPAGPDPAGDPLAGGSLDLRDRGEPARDRAARVAELPALPPRRLRGLRPALGRARGRPVRARRAPLRGDGGRSAADQLHPAGPRARDDRLAARLHRPAARRLSQPRLLHERRLALRPPGHRRGLRRHGARVARGGSADRRRLLRRRARPDRRRPRAPGGHQAGHAPPGRPLRRERHGPAGAARAGRRPALARREEPRPVPAPVPEDHRRPRRVRAHPGQLPGLEAPLRGEHRQPPALPRRGLRHRAAHRAARPQRRRARARDRHRRGRRLQHARQRVPQRRLRPGQCGTGRPLPVGARGALRADRGQPLPAAGGPLRAGLDPPPARLLGPQPARPPRLRCCPRRWPRRAWPT